MIAIIDYDTGNTRNVSKALDAVGAENILTHDPEVIRQANGLILPGVGAFPLAMEALEVRGLVDVLKQEVYRGKPLLGVCLGMQLLLEESFEHEKTVGLGFIKGFCKEIPEHIDFPVPHMGWNQLHIEHPNALTLDLEGKYVYFVHSFYADCPDEFVNASCTYSMRIPAMISHQNVYGAQFHPEKSSDVGLDILRKFKEIVYA